MRHIRLTVRHNPQDPLDDLKQVARLKRDLWVRSPVELDPESPAAETRRDQARNAYFELATDLPTEVEKVLRQYGHAERVTMADLGEVGLVCAKCGFLAGYVTVCPSCGHRDIDPCPQCRQEVPRERYEMDSGDLFMCPHCRAHVRMEFNPRLGSPDEPLAEPVVLVHQAAG